MEDAKEKNAAPAPAAIDKQVEFKRDDNNFVPGYANSVIVESNAFDMKLIFGLYDHRNLAKPVVDQISSMNISWPAAKLLIYWMQVHLDGYERENGKVKIPASVIPPEPPAIPASATDNPKDHAALDKMRKMRAEFLASLSEP